MVAPRIEVDLEKIKHNARFLAQRLAKDGISVTAVTKAVCGRLDIVKAMLDGGVAGLADAHIENVERMRKSGITSPICLIRTPMISQADRVIAACEASYNTELDVIHRLAQSALRANIVHGVVLMVEMGDHREGILPGDLEAIARNVMKIPGVALKGIGANFACLRGAAPDQLAMTELSSLAAKVEGACGLRLQIISGGNSANLRFMSAGGRSGRVNDLRLGEAILLGVDPITTKQINGLYSDAFTVVAEVIESRCSAQPTAPPLTTSTILVTPRAPPSQPVRQSILAIGKQDTDTGGLALPMGLAFVGATSDHLVVQTSGDRLPIGAEISCRPNYSALMRAMAAPNVEKVVRREWRSAVAE